MTGDDIIHESLRLGMAWEQLVATLTISRDPRTADPQSLYGAARAADHDRLVALLYGNQIGDSLDQAAAVLEEVLAMAREGRRPRGAAECGLADVLADRLGGRREDFLP